MEHTPLIDLVLVGAYFAIVLTIGIYSSRKQSAEGFLIANRSLGAFTDTASIVAAKTGAGVLVTFVAMVYLYGVAAIWVFIGAAAGYVVFIFFAVHLRQLSAEKRFYTLSDYFFHRFGKAAGLISAGIVLIYMIFVLLIQMIGGAKILNSLTNIPYAICLLLISITILIYMVAGGFNAVVKTDVFQFLAIMVLTALIGFILWGGSLGAIVNAAISSEKSAPIKTIVSFFLIGILLPFTSAELWQRVYAAKDAKTVRRTLVMTSILYPVIGCLILIIGLAISSSLTDIDPDLALVEGFRKLLPPGLLGISTIVFLAAILSSADSYLFVNVSIVLQDFYMRVRPAQQEHLVRLFRRTIPLFLLGCLVLSIWLQSIVDLTFFALAFGSVIAVCGIVSWIFPGIQAQTVIGGMICGVVGTFAFILASPGSETLVLKSIASTICGFPAGVGFRRLTSRGLKEKAL